MIHCTLLSIHLSVHPSVCLSLSLHKARRHSLGTNRRCQPLYFMWKTWIGTVNPSALLSSLTNCPDLTCPWMVHCFFLNLQFGVRICSFCFYSHFDGIHPICHRHWEQASPPSIWMGSEITTLLTEEQKRQNMATCENICLTILWEMCLSQPAKHFTFWSSEKQNNSDSDCYIKKSTGRQTTRGFMPGYNVQHYFWDNHSVKHVLQETVTEISTQRKTTKK